MSNLKKIYELLINLGKDHYFALNYALDVKVDDQEFIINQLRTLSWKKK